MIGRLRRVVRGADLLLGVLAYVGFEGMFFYYEGGLGPLLPNPELHLISALLLYFVAFSYAVTRTNRTHPYFQTDYRKWLEQTPWNVHKPLPQGPVHLVWEDGVVLGGLILLHWLLPFPGSIKVLNLFLIAHGLTLSWTFFATDVATFGYLVLFGLGLAVRFWPTPWACFAIAAATYLVAYEGLWRSLARFPWPAWEFLGTVRRVFLDDKQFLASSLGWPHDSFLKDVRDAEELRLNRLDAVLVSMLIGFGIFCIQSLFPNPRHRITFSALGLALVPMLYAIRLIVYARGCAEPISFWGRILNGWWIIPGYDRVFVGPLLPLLAAGGVLGSLYLAGVPLEISLPATVSAALATALLAPPRLRDWRLTGAYRMSGTGGSDHPRSPYVRAG